VVVLRLSFADALVLADSVEQYEHDASCCVLNPASFANGINQTHSTVKQSYAMLTLHYSCADFSFLVYYPCKPLSSAGAAPSMDVDADAQVGTQDAAAMDGVQLETTSRAQFSRISA